jgi:DNA-binding HxlR family transcriptional regulator
VSLRGVEGARIRLWACRIGQISPAGYRSSVSEWSDSRSGATTVVITFSPPEKTFGLWSNGAREDSKSDRQKNQVERREFLLSARLSQPMPPYGEYCSIALVERGPCRYIDLRNGAPGIASNLLAERMRELEQDGVIAREDAPPPIATTLFRLTPRGEQLRPVLDDLARWDLPLMMEQKPTDAVRSHWLAATIELMLTDRQPDAPPRNPRASNRRPANRNRTAQRRDPNPPRRSRPSRRHHRRTTQAHHGPPRRLTPARRRQGPGDQLPRRRRSPRSNRRGNKPHGLAELTNLNSEESDRSLLIPRGSATMTTSRFAMRCDRCSV